MLCFVHQTGKNILFPHLGPPEATDYFRLLNFVVIHGLEMLGLVHFDNKNCFTMVLNRPRCQIVGGAKLSVVPHCLRCQIVNSTLWCQIVHGAKFSVVPTCLRCQIVHGAKLSAVPNCQRCQIVWCQIVLVPNCPKIHETCVFDVCTVVQRFVKNV